jgi:hypothetical protein
MEYLSPAQSRQLTVEIGRGNLLCSLKLSEQNLLMPTRKGKTSPVSRDFANASISGFSTFEGEEDPGFFSEFGPIEPTAFANASNRNPAQFLANNCFRRGDSSAPAD